MDAIFKISNKVHEELDKFIGLFVKDHSNKWKMLQYFSLLMSVFAL